VLVRYNQRIERTDINALLLLSWYSINFFPRQYVEFGLLNGASAGIVASASPSTEIYLVDHWKGLQVESPWQGKAYPGYLACMLYDAGQRGYLQFINGEISTAVQRLKESFVGPLSFDLALVRLERLGASSTQHICELAKFMTPGGALILTGESESEFKLIWDECQLVFPDFSYLLCGDHKTGMILSVSPTSPDTKIPGNFEIKFAGDWTAKLLSRHKRMRQFHTTRTIATKFIKSLIGKTH
jgi:hypothetical protein